MTSRTVATTQRKLQTTKEAWCVEYIIVLLVDMLCYSFSLKCIESREISSIHGNKELHVREGEGREEKRN